MSLNVVEQLGQLGVVIEEGMIDVEVGEIVARVNGQSVDRVVVRDADAARARGRRRWMAPMAAAGLSAVLVAGLWVTAGERDRAISNLPQPSTPGPAATAPGTVTTEPARPPDVPVDAVFRIAVDTQVGYFEIYDQPTTEQTVLFARVGSITSTDFYDNATIAQGRTWASTAGTSGRPVIWGLVPADGTSWVQVGDRTVMPDDNGLWYTELQTTDGELVIHAPAGPLAIPLGGFTTEATTSPTTATTRVDTDASTVPTLDSPP